MLSNDVTTEPNTSAAHKDRSAFWDSYQKWDTAISYTRMGTWALVLLWVIAMSIFGAHWSLETRVAPAMIIPATGIAMYGWSAMQLKCQLLFRLFIAILLTAPLVGSIYLVVTWPAGL